MKKLILISFFIFSISNIFSQTSTKDYNELKKEVENKNYKYTLIKEAYRLNCTQAFKITKNGKLIAYQFRFADPQFKCYDYDSMDYLIIPLKNSKCYKTFIEELENGETEYPHLRFKGEGNIKFDFFKKEIMLLFKKQINFPFTAFL